MSHLLDRLNFFQKKSLGTFADGLGELTGESRTWEEVYRNRWRHDKIVRSTHGVNCTGSCSWKIYVKSGIVTWETQQTDYPRTRPDLPNHEPRGCSRGASYSWYLYSANRVKTPLVRSRLLKTWRRMRETKSPTAAWAAIQADPALRRDYVQVRGKGGFVRASWDEAAEMVAAANAYTTKKYGPDRVFGFSPIPAMSMISYAAGARYLSLLGGTCMSFYDWYCDLPPSSPQTWGEQTDVPESADWYNAGFLILWGSNVPQTRTPDAHFYTEARYRGAKSCVVSPDYSEASKFSDIWLSPKAGTDAALAMAMGHVILREFHLDRQAEYFEDYARRYTDMPMLVRLDEQDGRYVPGRMLRARDFDNALGQTNNPDWKTVAWDERKGEIVVPNGSIGFRWGEDGRWNLEEKAGRANTSLRLTQILEEHRDEVVGVDFPYFGGAATGPFVKCEHPEVLTRNVPVRRIRTTEGEVLVATVFDLFCANYGLDRGLGGDWVASDYDADVPYTPAWAEKITGVKANAIATVAREFALNAEKTRGKSMVILGAGLNHWYHMDMNYRGIINMLVMCGCVGQSGGGWSHYVGQEKLRPQTGWTALAFALDWARPPRHMNSTSAWYAHTDQWRYETVSPKEILCPTAPEGDWDGTPDRLQHPRRAHGLAAVGAAAQDQPAGGGPRGEGGRQGREGLRGRGAEVGRAGDVLRGSGRAGELAAQPLRLALEPARLQRQRARVFPQAPARHPARGARQGSRHGRKRRVARGEVARDGAGGEARPAGHPRLPHVHDGGLFRHRAADGELVREGRPQYLGHAPLHPPASGGGGPCLRIRARTGRSSRPSPASSARSRRSCLGSRTTWCSCRSSTTAPARSCRARCGTGSVASAS